MNSQDPKSQAPSTNPLSGNAPGESNSWWQKRRIKKILILGAAALTLAIICLGVWIYRLDSNIRQRFAEKRFAPPIEFYSAPESVRVGQRFASNYFASLFNRRNYRKRDFREPIRDGDFSIWSVAECGSVIDSRLLAASAAATATSGAGATMPNPNGSLNSPASSATPRPTPNPLFTGARDLHAPPVANSNSNSNSNENANANPGLPANSTLPMDQTQQNATFIPTIGQCIAFKNPADTTNRSVNSLATTPRASPESVADSEPATDSASGSATERISDLDAVKIIAFNASDEVIGVFAGSTPKAVASLEIEPELFASYFGDSPTLRTVVPLGTAPTMCLNALLAIEDSQFLEHSGVSFTGLLRAFLANLRYGRAAQGGSTITQQLVKNYFLNDKKTLTRKLTEIAMAFLVEQHESKDQILETYINLIYMGQNGPFQVRGFAAAASHYFGKNLTDLNLDQCALLAAVLNSPGMYNPFIHPEAALKRRNRVIERMSELKMVSEVESKAAKAAALPARPQRDLTEPAPYFVQAVRSFIEDKNIDSSEGLRVYTTLNLRAQEAAMQAVRSGVDRLETNYKLLQKLKSQKKNLEAVLISADPFTGGVQALVGGRGYAISQFNRATDSHRQVGSVMKPFVYLTALEHKQESGEPYTPVSIIKDEATTHKFDGQTWTPHNYEGTYEGPVPMYFALKESLNAATVNLGMSVGINNIIDTARRMGVRSNLKPLPSLTLGAFELTPMEVLEAYTSISRMGNHTALTLVHEIQDLSGKKLYSFEQKPEQVAAAESTAELVGMMKQTLLSGTARGARLAGFTNPAAGKTGTTNDKKDAWFVGFTPYHTALVWVGYDDNSPHGLTGATGAVPIWTSYMKSFSAYAPRDFAWPEGTENVTLSSDQLTGLGVPSKKGQPPEVTELVFIKGQVPAALAR